MAKQISLKSLLGKKPIKEHKLDNTIQVNLKMIINSIQSELLSASTNIKSYVKDDKEKDLARAIIAAGSIAKKAMELQQELKYIQADHRHEAGTKD
jgi:hypothetical protein